MNPSIKEALAWFEESDSQVWMVGPGKEIYSEITRLTALLALSAAVVEALEDERDDLKARLAEHEGVVK